MKRSIREAVIDMIPYIEQSFADVEFADATTLLGALQWYSACSHVHRGYGTQLAVGGKECFQQYSGTLSSGTLPFGKTCFDIVASVAGVSARMLAGVGCAKSRGFPCLTRTAVVPTTGRSSARQRFLAINIIHTRA